MKKIDEPDRTAQKNLKKQQKTTTQETDRSRDFCSKTTTERKKGSRQ